MEAWSIVTTAQLCAFRRLIGPTLYLGSMAHNVQECAGTADERQANVMEFCVEKSMVSSDSNPIML